MQQFPHTYLRALAEKLMRIPAHYDVDQGDVDSLLEIARQHERGDLAVESVAAENALTILNRLRSGRWTVAVHNDYIQDGAPMTFWLLTHPNGVFVRGEGSTDIEALEECQQAVFTWSAMGRLT